MLNFAPQKAKAMKSIKHYIALTLISALFAGCADLSGVESRLDALEQRVTDVESAVSALQRAMDEGRVITDVSRSADGWTLTFSDRSTIDVVNGRDGKDGEDGADGKDGRDGKDGKDGKDGLDGKDGRDGEDGKDGRDGVDGVDGAAGRNGVDGVTPFLLVDQSGYWAVSYDDGVTYTRLVDEQGAAVKAEGPQGERGEAGEQGEQGERGEQGEQGERGEAGEPGVSVRVVECENGYYALEYYRADAPEEVLGRVETPYTWHIENIIQSITRDTWRHTIVIRMADGTEYTFPQSYLVPTSIAVLAVRPLLLSEGGRASVEFRVNPSTAALTVSGQAAIRNLMLDRVGALTRADDYVTAPTAYRLVAIEQSYDEQGMMRCGQFRAVIEDTGLSRDYDEMAALVLPTTDVNGSDALVSSSAFEVKSSGAMLLKLSFLQSANAGHVATDVEVSLDGTDVTFTSPYIFDATSLVPTFVTNGEHVYANGMEVVSGQTALDFSNGVRLTVVGAGGEETVYRVQIVTTGLPLVEITTPGGAAVTSRTDWMDAAQIRIYDTNGNVDLERTTSIKGRGNSTWVLWPKKPYSLHFDEKGKVLGMDSNKRWVLLANALDRTSIRNIVALEAARRTCMEWTPRGQSVEVVMNSRHIGNYFLCEGIKVGKHRVAVTEMTPQDNDGIALTGGYLMEIDINYDRPKRFRSRLNNWPVMFRSPSDDITQAQFEYMRAYVDSMEVSLYDAERLARHEWERWLDPDMFADWWLLHELVNNRESSIPNSCYFYKERGDRVKFGPAWDFDWGTFLPSMADRVQASGFFIQKQLLTDPRFCDVLRRHWHEHRADFMSLPSYIDEQAEHVRRSNAVTMNIWPISTRINDDETLPFDVAVARMKDALLRHIAAMDAFIDALPTEG